jgi:chemotaxis-related protein WspB
MLVLTFQAAGNRYAIDVAHVVEVLPRIQLRPLPHAPSFLAGVFGYRGTVVPSVDLSVLLGTTGCRDWLSTRIILVDCRPAQMPQAEKQGDFTEPALAGESVEQETARPKTDQHPESPGKPTRWLLGLIAEQVSEVAPIRPQQIISPSIQLAEAPYLGAIIELGHQLVQLILVDKLLEPSLQRSFFEAVAQADREIRQPETARLETV